MKIRSIKTAAEEMTKPGIIDISGGETLNSFYLSSLEGLDEEIEGIEREIKEGEDKDKIKKRRDMIYQKAKITMDEVKRAKEKVEEKEEKAKLNKTYILLHRMITKHFPDKVAEEKKNQKKATELPAVLPMAAPSPSATTPATAPAPPAAPPVMASKRIASLIFNKAIELEVKEDLLKDYAEKICQTISHKHEAISYEINPERSSEIRIFDNKELILKIGVNDLLSVDNVVPVGKLYQIYPFHSVEFYQKYWKPIMEAIGHFCIGNPSIIILVGQNTLPDVMKKNKAYTISGWNSKDKIEESIDISFKGERPIWMLEVSKMGRTASKIDFSTIKKVKCIDKNLESINGKEGIVVHQIPSVNPDVQEIDVNFGKIGTIRLTTNQVAPLG